MTISPLSMNSLSKRYGDMVAVDELSLNVEPGSIVALLGPNGAGKSTVMHCTIGTRQPTSGSVELFGRPVRELAEPLRSVGFAGEFLGLEQRRSIEQQLRSVARAARTCTDRTDQVIEQCGLAAVRSRSVRKLSTGERMRASLAMALLGEPELLVLDEPTNGLDADGIRWMRGLLRRHREQGGSVLLASHLLSEVEQLADHLVVLNRSVRYEGPMSGLMAEGETLEDAYFGLLEAARAGIAETTRTTETREMA